MSVRFAPSPTGMFHVGNLRTAWISRQWSRALGLPWAVRFEDIDTPRVVPGAQEAQRREMLELHLIPDVISVQSANRARHWSLFEKARRDGVVYPCRCSRKEILTSLASAPHAPEALYSGRCRRGLPVDAPDSPTIAWRFKTRDESGQHDFIVGRTDAAGSADSYVPAYHWACAIDDADEKHLLLVRAHDLFSATATQRLIQDWLGVRDIPAVFHTALVTADDGHRLEKRTRGVTLPELKDAGVTPERLIHLFEKSFQAKGADFAPGKIWGEPQTRITLSELGLTCSAGA